VRFSTFFGYVFVDDETLQPVTDLTRVSKTIEEYSLHNLVDVGIVKKRFAGADPPNSSNALMSFSAAMAVQLFTDSCATGEADEINVFVDERITYITTAIHLGEDTRWEF